MSLENYIKGERYGKKAYELEKKAMRDPFLQDAIDGYDLEGDQPAYYLKKLKKEIHKQTRPNLRKLQLWSIAAGILIIIFASVFFLLYEKDNKDVDVPGNYIHANKSLDVDSILTVKATLNNQDSTSIANEAIIANSINQQVDLLAGKEDLTVQQAGRRMTEEYQRTTGYSRRNEISNNTISTREIQDILSDYKTNEPKVTSSPPEQTPAPVIEKSAYDDYINNNRNPLPYVENEKQQGKVILMFKVNENGRPVDISILRSLNQAADREAVRLLQNGPNWTVSNKNTYLEVNF